MKVGVALAGGGLKGVAYIGALKAFEELGIHIDCISGTSFWKYGSSLIFNWLCTRRNEKNYI